MFDKVIEVCPSFRLAWYAFLEEWENEPCELPLYLALSDLARHVLNLLEDGDVDEPRAVLRLVDVWIFDGGPYVREAAIVGFLEDLGNYVHDSMVQEEAVVGYLGSESRRWWKKLHAFWAGDSKALRDD